jgi:hypothetical protein
VSIACSAQASRFVCINPPVPAGPCIADVKALYKPRLTGLWRAEMPADAAEPGEMESPGRWSGAARPADPWWSSTSPSSARSGLASPGGMRTGAGGRAEAGLRIGGGGSGGARRERPSMFDHRRGR